MRQSNLEDGVGHISNSLSQGGFAQKFTPDIVQVKVAGSMVSMGDAFDTQIRSQGIQTQQQTFAQVSGL